MSGYRTDKSTLCRCTSPSSWRSRAEHILRLRDDALRKQSGCPFVSICSARQARTRRCSVRSTPSPKMSPCRRCNSSSKVLPCSAGSRSSSGTSSVSHTAASGSVRVRHVLGPRCDGNPSACSMRRAERTLMPRRAAAICCVVCLLASLYLRTCWSVIFLPGTAASPNVPRQKSTVSLASGPSRLQIQPAKIVVVDRSG